MAVTAAPINSTDVVVQITEDSGSTYDTVGSCTSASFSWSMDPRDITTKDSSGDRELAGGKIQGSISFDGLTRYDTATDVDRINDIYALADTRTSVGIRYGKVNTGDFVVTADGYFTSISLDSGVEDNHTFSVSFEISGAITMAAVS